MLNIFIDHNRFFKPALLLFSTCISRTLWYFYFCTLHNQN